MARKTSLRHTDAGRYPYRKARFYGTPMDADLRPGMTNFSN
ncbi:MAG: hypothetical protein ACOVSW_03025 [Candidatus Kapaibacteriota bacterium]